MASSNSPCAACKFLRRKCTQGCVFAPYFPPDQPSKFSNVHRVFGASNVAKLLNDLNPVQREDAVNSLAYEAEARLNDPVYGCVGHISLLQQKLRQVQNELYNAKQELSTYIGPAAFSPFLPHPLYPHPHAALVGGQAHHHHHHIQAAAMPPFGVPGAGMGLGLGAAAPTPQQQMLVRDQQQQQHQQMVEQHHHQQQIVAVAAAREQQEYLRMEQQHQQQQHEQFVRLSTGSDGRFNQTGGGTAAVSLASGPPSGLALVPAAAVQQFDNLFHVQQQQFHDQQQNHHHQRARSDEVRSGTGRRLE